eukprot:1559509-Pyramimonas_sp.AAC.1
MKREPLKPLTPRRQVSDHFVHFSASSRMGAYSFENFRCMSRTSAGRSPRARRGNCLPLRGSTH